MKKTISILFVLLIAVLSYVLIRNYYHAPGIYPYKSQFYTWAGDTRVITPDSASISIQQLKKLRASFKPGDFFLNRSDYYISNIGIPGFWTHSGLYIGFPDELDNFFSEDKDCYNWVVTMGEVSGNFTNLLNNKFPIKYHRYVKNEEVYPVVEALSEGVLFSSFTDAAAKDGIVVLRPKLSKLEIAKAVYHAFKLVDRPYDFNFDFSSDSLIACTELIHCVYQDSKLFTVEELFGNPFVTANEIAQYYDDNFENGSLKMEMIFLFDGETVYTSKSIEGQQIFRKSWEDSFW